MGTLERVLDMQKKGMSDNQIAQTLMQEGTSPKEISDSLSQAKIKTAVGVENSDEMQPSIMNSNQQNNSSQGQQYAYSESNQQTPIPVYGQQAAPQKQYAPPPQQAPVQQYAYAESQQPAYQEQYAQPQEQYIQPQYQEVNTTQQDQQGYGTDLETIRDIAKREVEAPIIKLRQQVEISTKIALELKSQIQVIDNRLSKTETIIQELQSAIIRKMGEYGETISGISQEIQETQKSFSKLINPILDKKREDLGEEEEETEKNEEPQRTRTSRNQNEGFKNYLR